MRHVVILISVLLSAHDAYAFAYERTLPTAHLVHKRHSQITKTANNNNINVHATKTDSINENNYTINSRSKYHLIWSPTFWYKFIISSVMWLVIQHALINSMSSSLEKILFSQSSCNTETTTLATVIILPLLSSSCCAIQLIINALTGFGCLGFNRLLGPIRPLILPLLLLSTYKLLPHRSPRWTILSLLLTFLPECIDILNRIRTRKVEQQKNNDIQQTMSSAKLTLDCPTMGCVACVNKIDSSIRQCKSSANIIEETSWLTDTSKGGKAELLISAATKKNIYQIVDEVIAAIKKNGFECSVDSIQYEYNSNISDN